MRQVFVASLIALLCACPGNAGVTGTGDAGTAPPDAGPKVPVCGDAELDTGEACDDGNDLDTDACLSDCTLAACGDGIRRTDLSVGDLGFESCDDGNDDDFEACRDA